MFFILFQFLIFISINDGLYNSFLLFFQIIIFLFHFSFFFLDYLLMMVYILHFHYFFCSNVYFYLYLLFQFLLFILMMVYTLLLLLFLYLFFRQLSGSYLTKSLKRLIKGFNFVSIPFNLSISSKISTFPFLEKHFMEKDFVFGI